MAKHFDMTRFWHSLVLVWQVLDSKQAALCMPFVTGQVRLVHFQKVRSVPHSSRKDEICILVRYIGQSCSLFGWWSWWLAAAAGHSRQQPAAVAAQAHGCCSPASRWFIWNLPSQSLFPIVFIPTPNTYVSIYAATSINFSLHMIKMKRLNNVNKTNPVIHNAPLSTSIPADQAYVAEYWQLQSAMSIVMWGSTTGFMSGVSWGDASDFCGLGSGNAGFRNRWQSVMSLLLCRSPTQDLMWLIRILILTSYNFFFRNLIPKELWR